MIGTVYNLDSCKFTKNEMKIALTGSHGLLCMLQDVLVQSRTSTWLFRLPCKYQHRERKYSQIFCSTSLLPDNQYSKVTLC